MIFGSKTESSKNLIKENEKQKQKKFSKPKTKPKGHGRMGSGEYKSAEQINVVHDELISGSACPSCKGGKVYPVRKPKVIVRITGNAPFESKIYKLEQFRCNLCQLILTAKLPDVAGNEKYDMKAKALVPILRYGSGFPHYRLETLQNSLGHPFPDSNWDSPHYLTPTYNGICHPVIIIKDINEIAKLLFASCLFSVKNITYQRNIRNKLTNINVAQSFIKCIFNFIFFIDSFAIKHKKDIAIFL